ncbi:MAG: hypothetical protein JSV16_13355 [Candidatus Hydrogenedentota bacterium]|nr:MAG: hypothetical protein JSV16_13355 [Candidatus Hydrogenedentota bacterium]
MKYDDNPANLARTIARLDAAIARAQKARQILIEWRGKAQEKLTDHETRIGQNESDIAAGKTTLQDHEARIAALEGGP